MTQITKEIAAKITLDAEANRQANIMLGAIREFAHRATTAAVVAYAARKYPRLTPAEAVAKLAQLASNEMAMTGYLGGVLRTQYEAFAAEHKPAIASAVRERSGLASRAAQLKVQIDNAGIRHAEKIKGLRSVLTAGELSQIQPPNIDSLSAELVAAEEKITALDDFISSHGLKAVPEWVDVAEPLRVSFPTKEAA